MNERAATHRPPVITLRTATASPGRLLNLAHMRLRQGLVAAVADAGHTISGEAWPLLAALWEQDDISQVELGQRVGKNRHHTSRLIDALETEGLVERVAADNDRRSKHVRLTRRGKAAQRALVPVVERYLNEAFAGVSESDYEAFIRCLVHLAREHEPSTVIEDEPE